MTDIETGHDQRQMRSSVSMERMVKQQIAAGGGASARLLVLMLAIAPLLAGAAFAAWAYSHQQHMTQLVEDARRQAALKALATSTRVTLKVDDPHHAHRLRKIAAEQGISNFTVTLPDGRVIAASSEADQNAALPPDPWEHPARPIAGAAYSTVVELPGLGEVAVTMQPTLTVNNFLAPLWPVAAIAGAMMIAGVALGQLVLRRIRPLAAVQSALHTLAAGEKSCHALHIADRWGRDAVAWNDLMDEREAFRQRLVTGTAEPGSRGRRGGSRLLQSACDAMSCGVLILDSTGRVRYINGAGAILLGEMRDELADRPYDEILTEETVVGAVRDVAIDGKQLRTSVEMSSQESQSILRFSVSRLAGETRPGTLITIEDVSQQRIADHARDSFVAQATHELRTPLTNIRLYLEQMLEEGEDDPAIRGNCLNVISRESNRLERMVGDMLSVAEIEAGSLKLHVDDVRLDTLMEELSGDFRPQADEKQITLQFDFAPKLPVIQGDRDKIALTVHNLVANALKYTPSGGTVIIRTSADDGFFKLEVADTGLGIAPEEQDQIFEKFFRSNDQRVGKITGTGLGLALAREVARLHGGDIVVESEIDQGSTFTMTLPASAEAA